MMNYPSKYFQKQLYSEIPTWQAFQILQSKKAVIIGAGGLGCPCIETLSSSGLGLLHIIDFDRVEESNLARQTIYKHKDIGKYKAEVACDYISRKNTHIYCSYTINQLTPSNAESLLSDFDIIIDATDNIGTRYLINDVSDYLKTPFIYGAIHLTEGFVSTFNYENGAHYRDLFPKPPKVEISDCNEQGAITSLTQIIGTLQAEEAIRTLYKKPKLNNKLFIFDIKHFTSSTLTIPKNKGEYNVSPADYQLASCTNIKQITFERIDELEVNYPSLIKIDVRNNQGLTPFENCEYIPLHNIHKIAEQYNKEQPLLLFCEKGVSSLKAATILKERYKFEKIFNLKDGIRLLQNA